MAGGSRSLATPRSWNPELCAQMIIFGRGLYDRFEQALETVREAGFTSIEIGRSVVSHYRDPESLSKLLEKHELRLRAIHTNITAIRTVPSLSERVLPPNFCRWMKSHTADTFSDWYRVLSRS